MFHAAQPSPNAAVSAPVCRDGGGPPHAVSFGSTGITPARPDDEVRVPRESLRRLCSAAAAAGIAHDEVARCLAGAGSPCEPGFGETPAPSQPIALYTLGRFALVRDGEPLAFHGKAPHKPIELMLALVALGGRGVHTALLMAAVWPGDESTDLRNLFDNTLHRLRRLLDCDGALVASDSRITIDPSRCWVDAWAFDRLASIGEQAAASSAAGLAMRLYQGHFLEREAPRPWIHAYRERLRSRYRRLVVHEGARLEAQGRWSDAATCYERGIEQDALAEPLYRQLMACHLRCRAPAEALQVYARCRVQLQSALAASPCAATEALLRTARAEVARTAP